MEWGYLAGRIATAAGVLLAAFTVAFLMLQALPGDAVMIRFEDPELGLTEAQIAEVRAAYGTETPLLQQYWSTLTAALRGDFGYSVASGAAITTLLGAALPSTFLLAGLGFLAALILASLLAFGAILSPSGRLAGFLRGLPSLFVSVPVFWLGIVLIQVFSFRLGWISVIRPGPVEALILPVLTLAIPISAPIAQVLVRAMDDVAAQPFVAVVRSKGAGQGWVLIHAILRNAALPALTIAGVLLGELIGGAVVTETVFARFGIGRLTADALATQDTPVLMAIVVVAAAAFVVVNLVVDLLAPAIDPRLRRRVAA
ncbi:ABC transporter permease [Serinibacter salmoneus]|uniref:Peptide/nickel transport system permease protein n=1 Tax=Serinibacter salmoneus TaxID=556530 RepID=A0A2A9D0J1_9MICO|nr:ABC transporter permease [Serinibacter salmoneus]PFG20163.1 peptide/nickel transport system permease protein [Serinibacter salmoneus]